MINTIELARYHYAQPVLQMTHDTGLSTMPDLGSGPSLRILYHHRTAASDGMRVHIDEIVSALRARGHCVRIVGPGQDSRQRRTNKGNRLEGIAAILRRVLPASLYELVELLYNIPAYLRLAREVRSFRPDVLYERYNLFLLAGLLLCRWHGLPMILEVNSPLASERAEFGNLRLRSLARACETALWRGADAVLPVTRVLAEQVCARRKTEAGIHVVPNGARLDLKPDEQAVAAVRRRFGLSGHHVVLGFSGFVRAWHGVGWALDALTELPSHVHLLVVGDGPALLDLEARSLAIGVGDRVHFSGRVPHHEIPAHLQAFDIALQTAAVAYASPLKLFEYMALGRAIIAPDQPNIREILKHGVNALLFAPDMPASFKKALTQLCLDDALRATLGQQARKSVEDIPLTWAQNAARIEKLAREMTPPSQREQRAAPASLSPDIVNF